ncbi:MAG TPA: ABC transporter substrate-binding protein [Pyrinomonadaceae bacterium]
MKNKRRRYLALVIIAGFVLTSIAQTGCRKQSGGAGGGPGAGANGKMVVGFSQMENDGPWRIAETNSMKNEAARLADKFELVVTDAQGQTSKQVSDVEDLVSRGVSAIFLAPREKNGLEPAMQAAKEARIPIILVDREASGTAGEDFVTVLKSDFIEQGRRAAEWLAQHTNGKASIVELSGTSGASVSQDRQQGFADEIKKHQDMKIIASQTGNFNRAEGQKVMQNIIQSMGQQITAVYAHNDEMAIGAIQALKGAGMKPGKDIRIVSVDGERAALQAIIDGDMNATVESNPRFGPLAFETLQKIRNGEKVPPKIILPDRFFDASNAKQYLNEAY